MNYWLLTTEYPPFHGGGISTYCYHSARMLSAGGIAVTIFVPDDSVQDYAMSAERSLIRIVRFNSNRSKTASFLGYTARLSYEFAMIVKLMIATEGRPDVIESQDYLGIAYYLLQFKYLGYDDVEAIPICITLHSPAFLYLDYNRAPVYKFPDFWTCEMEKNALVMADQLISPTNYIAEAVLASVPIKEKKIPVIRNPFSGFAEQLVSIKRNKIVFYGKLSRQKGSFEMLTYFSDLWNKGFRHPLHIIGGMDIVYHPERLTMEQIIKREYGMHISHGMLILHGKITPSSVEQELKNAHVIIVPSIIDNLPYVIIESMSLGKTVLASIQGGQQEMIEDGIDGFLFDHNKPGDFERQLSVVLDLPNDRLHAIGKAAIVKSKALYSIEIIAKAKIDLIKQLIARKQLPVHFPFLYQENFISLPSNKNNGKLSVVIPYYNMGKYIDDCISSIQQSTYPDIEIIIVDDGSNENDSLTALDQWENKKNIKIYPTKNHGLAEARNYGALKANGDFVAFLDADDRVMPDYYKKAIVVLSRYENIFFAGSWVKYFGDSQGRWVAFTPQPPYLLVHNPVNSSGLVYKRPALINAGLNDKMVDYGLEDYESVISMTAQGYNGIVLPEFLFNYRVRSNSMIRKITRAKLLYSYSYIAKKHAVYYAKFAAETVNLLNANGPGFLFDNPTIGISVISKPENAGWMPESLKSFIKKNKTLKKIALKIIKYTKIWL